MGIGLPADADAGTIEAALRRLAGDDACRRLAMNLKRHHDGYRPDLAIGAVADALDDLLQGEAST